MFENIRLYHYETPIPVSNTGDAGLLMPSPEKSLSQAEREQDLTIRRKIDLERQNYDTVNSDTTFRISGSVDIFPVSIYPTTQDQPLYFLQAFSIFTSDERFFTRRKNYESFLILYTYEGCGVLEYEGQTYHIPPGSGFFIDCREPHYYHTFKDGDSSSIRHSNWKYATLHVSGPATANLFDCYLQDGSPVFADPVNGEFQNRLEKILIHYSSGSRHRNWLVSDSISHLLTLLLTTKDQASSVSGSSKSLLTGLLQYLDTHFTEKTSLDDLAQRCGLSKFYLSREFRKITGFSPINYLVHLRIEHAKTLLLTTSLSIHAVSCLSGYEDINNFNRLFKKNTGLTPGAFRSSYQTRD